MAAERRPCSEHFGPCQESDYNKWFRKVASGEIKYFYPKRILLFEIPGTILVLFNCVDQALIGEAKINGATFEESFHKYWFDEFLTYPQPISLRKLRAEQEFKRIHSRTIPKGGRWWIFYIEQDLLRDIRSLSGLQEDATNRLNAELDVVQGRIQKSVVPVRHRTYSHGSRTFNSQREIEKLRVTGVSASILGKTEKILSGIRNNADLKGKPPRLFLYAALYIAYRSEGIPKRLEEIPQVEGYNKRRFASAVRLLIWKLQISLPIVSAEQWTWHYSKLLGLSERIAKSAVGLVKQAPMHHNLRGRTPRALAAAAIYVICVRTRQRIGPKQIASITGISLASLRILSKMWIEVENVA